MIDQRQCHLWYDILNDNKSDVKKLIPKKLEEFTLVIVWPHQILGFKGSTLLKVLYVFVVKIWDQENRI